MNLRRTCPKKSCWDVVCSWQHHTDDWNPPKPKKQPVIGLTVASKARLAARRRRWRKKLVSSDKECMSMTKDIQSSHLRRSHDLGSNVSWMIRSRLNPVSQNAYLLWPAIFGGQISSSRFSSLGSRWSNGYDSGRLSRWPGRSGFNFEGDCDGGGVSWAPAGFFSSCGRQILPLAIKLRLSAAFPVAAPSGMHPSLFALAISDNPWPGRSYSWLDDPGLFDEEIWSVRTSGASVRHLAMETNENKERPRIQRMGKSLTKASSWAWY